jgi:large subunit ribosomal protein L6
MSVSANTDPAAVRVAVAISAGRVQVERPARRAASRCRADEDRAAGRRIVVTRPTDRGADRALHGLTRTLIANMVEGVTKGFEKRLEIQGVGYRAALRGSDSSSRSASRIRS